MKFDPSKHFRHGDKVYNWSSYPLSWGMVEYLNDDGSIKETKILWEPKEVIIDEQDTIES